jgi:DNA-binding NarL/FixJ family response regulator
MTITIVLADDHNVVRQGLRSILDAEADMKIIAEAANGNEAIRIISELKPDVAVLDIMMPGMNGIEVARQIHHISPVLILSMHDSEVYVLEALRNGASGYLLKDSTSKELIDAIHTIASGNRFLSAPFSERAISAYVEKSKSTTINPFDTLTNREREVFYLLVESRSTKHIAENLLISARTVETHRANIMSKLNLKSQTDLIKFAIKHGYLSLED